MIIFFLPSNYFFKLLSKWTLVGFCPTFRLFRLSCAYHRPNQTHVLNPEFPVDPTGFAVPSSQDQDTCACFQRSDGMGWLIGWEEKLKGLLMEQIRVTTWMGSLSYCVQGFTGFLNHQLYWAMVEGSCERICSKKGQFWKIFQTVSLEGLTSMHFDVAWESWLGQLWRSMAFRTSGHRTTHQHEPQASMILASLCNNHGGSSPFEHLQGLRSHPKTYMGPENRSTEN